MSEALKPWLGLVAVVAIVYGLYSAGLIYN
jgi:hypothetical protein